MLGAARNVTFQSRARQEAVSGNRFLTGAARQMSPRLVPKLRLGTARAKLSFANRRGAIRRELVPPRQVAVIDGTLKALHSTAQGSPAGRDTLVLTSSQTVP